jgi:hypothetical protein
VKVIKANAKLGKINDLRCSLLKADNMFRNMQRGCKYFFGGFANTYTT